MDIWLLLEGPPLNFNPQLVFPAQWRAAHQLKHYTETFQSLNLESMGTFLNSRYQQYAHCLTTLYFCCASDSAMTTNNLKHKTVQLVLLQLVGYHLGLVKHLNKD